MTATARGFVSLLVYRFLFGAGEAGAFPACARAFHSWLPVGERGLAQGVNFSGSRLGAAFALPVVAAMVVHLGWRASFLVLAAVGFVWAAWWWWWFVDDPARHPGVSAGERALILRGRELPGGEAAGPLPLRRMLASRNVWLAMGQYFCSNFTFFFCLTWLFPHLRSTYGLEAVEAGFFAAAPFLAGALGNWAGGGLVDVLYRRGAWTGSRRWPAMVGFALAAAGLVGMARAESAESAVAFLSVAIFGADMTLPPSWSLCIDVGRSHAGKVSGTMNMAGNLGSFVTGLAFPYLQAWTGSAAPFFYAGAALNVLAILAWRAVRPEEPLDPGRG
jgi:MFS transporter, ACS family, glucarate transporter